MNENFKIFTGSLKPFSGPLTVDLYPFSNLKRSQMMNDQSITVEYTRQGEDAHFLAFGSKAFSDIKIDYAGMPLSQRGGTANRLLLASALFCYASTFAAAMAARGAKIQSLSGKAKSETGKDEWQRPKIDKIRIEIGVQLEEKYLPVLEKCQKIMEKGCFITLSLIGGIQIEHSITRVSNT